LARQLGFRRTRTLTFEVSLLVFERQAAAAHPHALFSAVMRRRCCCNERNISELMAYAEGRRPDVAWIAAYVAYVTGREVR